MTRAARLVLRRLRLALCLAVAVCMPGAIGAQSASTTFDSLDLEVTATAPWPDGTDTGFVPLQLSFENNADAPQSVSLEAIAKRWIQVEHRVSSAVTVPAHATIDIELFVPAFELDGSPYMLELKSGGYEEHLRVPSNSSWGGDGIRSVLVLTDADPAPATIQAWAETLGETVHYGSERQPDVSIAALPPNAAPLRFEAYTSLDCVVVDARTRLDVNVLEPVLTYARLGGTLAFLGADAERAAYATAGVAEWIEPRFRDASIGPVAAQIYTIGHGRLVVGQDDSFLGTDDRNALRATLENHANHTPDPDHLRRYQRSLPVPGVRELPYRSFIIVLILFAILIGPVNFFIVKSTGRPGWLLITIPLLAFIASVGILSYGILYQGIDLKQASETFTLLDQRAHRADTVAVRSFFAGISPTDALRPGPGTATLPVRTRSRGNALFLMSFEPSPALRGEFLPVRRETTQVVLSERAARGRLTFRAEGDAFVAQNAFEAPVERLCFRDVDGVYYTWNLASDVEDELEDAVDPGAEMRLERIDAHPELAEFLPRPLDARDLGWALGMPRRSYVAILSTNPFQDSTGLEPETYSGQHVVLGVLDGEGALGAEEDAQ